jgi:hypothetical protein
MDQQPVMAVRRYAPVETPLQKGKTLAGGQGCEGPVAVEFEAAMPPAPAGVHAHMKIRKAVCGADDLSLGVKAANPLGHDGQSALNVHHEGRQGEPQPVARESSPQFGVAEVSECA